MGDDDGVPPALAQIINKVLEQDSKYSRIIFPFALVKMGLVSKIHLFGPSGLRLV